MAGLFSGGSLALLAVFAVLMHDLLPKYRPVEGGGQEATSKSDDVYFETIFPIFRSSITFQMSPTPPLQSSV